MNISKTIKGCNEWLASNNIKNVTFKRKHTADFGTVIGLYSKGKTKDVCIFHSPALGEVTSLVCREYNLDYNNRPNIQ